MSSRFFVLLALLNVLGCASEALPPAPTTTASYVPVIPCCAPLQGWMREHVGLTMTEGDMTGVASALERTSSFSPDATWEWHRIASEGAAAARENDEGRVRAACRACHERYRPTYRTQFRDRPLAD